MMPTEATVVSAFQGIQRGNRSRIRSDRNGLDAPRELLNLHINEQGHIWMPPATRTLIHEFAATHAPILSIAWMNEPRGIFCHTSEAVYFFDQFSLTDELSFPASVEVLGSVDINEHGWPFWFVGLVGGPTYMGYSPRGVGAADGQTWKVEYNNNDPIDGLTVTEITSSVPEASSSVMYKGRRFVVKRGTNVKFSDLNQPETFGVDSEFDIGGDDAGEGYQTFQGDVQGMQGFEDMLVFFMTQSVWILNGATPDTFQLREAETAVGAIQHSVARVSGALAFVGGEHYGDRGAYLFTGSSAEKISSPVDEFFRDTSNLTLGTVRTSGLSVAGRYIIAVPRNTDRQVYVYSVENRQWATFGGYGSDGPKIAMGNRSELLIGDGASLYSVQDADNSYVFPRRPGETSKFTLGWHDDDHPTGFVRFLAVKVSGWKSGTGTPTLSLIAYTPDGSMSEVVKDLTIDVFEGLVFPLNIRGNAVDLEFEITPTADDQQTLIESVQLVYSRKGEKVSRS